MSTYDNAVLEAKHLLGDLKAMKGSTVAAVMLDPRSKEYFAVRATRVDGLVDEGFTLVAQIDSSGNITKTAVEEK